MGLEDDLFEALKYVKFGGKAPANKMVKQLILSVQIGVLKRLKADIDKMISDLASQGINIKDMGDLDPFKILGVSPNATKEEVDKAYRKASAKAHPDKGGSNEEMAKVNAAYEVICRFKGWRK